jgi:hypothetical protein
MKRLASFLLLLCLGIDAARAEFPNVFPIALGTSSVTVLPANTARNKVIFHNPNPTALVAVCPVGPPTVPGSPQIPIVAVIGGAGCVTILPYDRFEVTGPTWVGSSGSRFGSAWVGIASAPGSALTILEF